MRDGIESRGVESGDDAAHLQPLTSAEIKAIKATEDLDRLLGDAELLLRLQLSGSAWEEWEPIVTEFARYGLGVLPAWLATGKMFVEVRKTTKVEVTISAAMSRTLRLRPCHAVGVQHDRRAGRQHQGVVRPLGRGIEAWSSGAEPASTRACLHSGNENG